MLKVHEWTIATNIVDSMVNYAKTSGVKILGVKVYIGEMTLVDRRILANAIKSMLKRFNMSCSVRTIIVEAKFKCESCGHVWRFSEVKDKVLREAQLIGEDPPFHYISSLIYPFMTCPKCGSYDYKIVSGKTIEYKVIVEG